MAAPPREDHLPRREPVSAPESPSAPPDGCWRKIGVWGDHSCERLGQEIHCQNCGIYTLKGRELFDRPAPEEYLKEWTRLLATEKEEVHLSWKSIVGFRVGDEWFGLSTSCFVEVHHFRTIHRIPHCPNPALLGLANIRGSLLICVSLRPLLGQGGKGRDGDWKEHDKQTRLAVVEREGRRLSLKLDEIDGILQYSDEQLRPPPVNIAKGSQTFTRGLIRAGGRTIGLLDEELLFHYFKSRLT